jgi:hypothetical protein
VPKCIGVLSSPIALDGNAVPPQAGLLLGQLLQTPFIVPFLSFSTKIQRTGPFFGPFPIICLFFLVIVTMYFYFGTVVVGESNLSFTLESPTLFFFWIRSEKDHSFHEIIPFLI